MGLEHSTDPQTLHPSPGLGEVPSWLLWESLRSLPTGVVAGAFLGIRERRGAVGVPQKGSSEGRLESRMEQLGTCQPHQSEGTEQPQCQHRPCSTRSSGGHIPWHRDPSHLRNAGHCPSREPWGGPGADPAQSSHGSSRDWDVSHSSNVFPRSPTQRWWWLDVPGAHRSSGTA